MKQRSPVVSVVIPTYNRGDVLGRSIRSVLEQTYSDFEVLVVDDGSSDHTASVVRDFDDSRVNYLAHEENRGAAAARNTGIRAANGEFIAFQDSDDEWLPRKLEKQMAVFDRVPEEVGVVYSAFYDIAEEETNRVPDTATESIDGDVHERLLEFNFISTQVAVVRRGCFRTVGLFDEDLPRLIDWELWIRLSEQYRFEFIDEPLVKVYRQPDSISEDDSAGVLARDRILEKHRHRFDPSELAAQQFWVGHGYLKIGQTRKGRRYLARALKNDPRPIYLSTFLVSLLGGRLYRTVYEVAKNSGRRLDA